MGNSTEYDEGASPIDPLPDVEKTDRVAVEEATAVTITITIAITTTTTTTSTTTVVAAARTTR